MRKTKQMIEDEPMTGEEPAKFDPPVTNPNDTRLTHAFQWYNYYLEVDDLRHTIEEFIIAHPSRFVKNAADLIGRVPSDYVSMVDCSIGQILKNGNTLPKEIIDRFVDRVNKLLEKAKKPEPNQSSVPKKSPAQHTKDAAGRLIADLDTIVDICEAGDTIDVYRFLTNRNVGGKTAEHIREYYCEIAIEMAQTFNEEDDDLVYAHRHMTKAQIEQRFELFNEMVEHLDRFLGNKIVVRKPRKKKSKPASKQVAKAKYQLRDDALQLVSINPEQIVGASQLWVYNTDKEVLSVYNAAGPEGLAVKGTTIKNYNEETALSKKLRKPKETLDELRSAGKVALRSFINNLSTKEKVASGRLNDVSILVRAIK